MLTECYSTPKCLSSVKRQRKCNVPMSLKEEWKLGIRSHPRIIRNYLHISLTAVTNFHISNSTVKVLYLWLPSVSFAAEERKQAGKLYIYIYIQGWTNKITKKLRIEFVLATLKEIQLEIPNVFFRLFILCSARVSSLVIVLSDSQFERIRKRKTCTILKYDSSFVSV
jgi:hypothetical protein